MSKTRYVLALMMVMSALVLFAAITDLRCDAVGGVVSVVAICFSLPTLLASLIMFLFSLFRIYELPDGRLAYSKSNIYWRFMHWIYGKDTWKDKTSICLAFWLTSLVVFAGILCAICLVSLGYIAWFFMTHGITVSVTPKDFLPLIYLLMFLAGFYLGITLLLKSQDHKKLSVIYLIGSILILVADSTALPIYGIMTIVDKSLTEALNIYFGYVGLVIGIYGGVILIVMLVAKVLPSVLKGTILEKFYIAIKERFCPILFAD